MIPILASTSEALSLGNWILVAFTISSGVSTIVALVSLFATRREVEALERRLAAMEEANDALRDQIVQMERRLTEASEKRIDHLDGKIAELAREFGDATRSLPMQIVTLLKNTGALE